jgi:hypothetical protein
MEQNIKPGERLSDRLKSRRQNLRGQRQGRRIIQELNNSKALHISHILNALDDKIRNSLFIYRGCKTYLNI